jgi:NSS family neurotransmitter:Na+ symporter
LSETGRGQWGSKVGFILAASGSAIGLGNIVFFSANAYRFGGGAFYLPYFVALFLIGIPVMILEFGLGHQTRRAFPEALHRAAGRKGEFMGWWALMNASFITLYYITILGWVMGMLVGALGGLWKDSTALPAFAPVIESLPNPHGYFFNMLSTWKPVIFVAIVWFFNALIVRRGTATIEAAVRLFVPLMWIFMIVLIVRGITLPNGLQGVWLLFTPNFEVMKDPAVWQGAFSQIFFTLSLGFGVMTAYASYLPRDSDTTNNSLLTALMNCGFEYIAGLAIFSILFAFAMVPTASTLAMMFFIVPAGIGQMPGGDPAVIAFGLLFFLLLLMAGLSSSVSLVEGLASALIDKFKISRGRAITIFCLLGAMGSMLFALPQVVNPGLENNGTLGLTLLDLVDHWAFSYGLLIVGLLECLLVGWAFGAGRLRKHINSTSRFTLGPWYDILIKFVIPGLLIWVLGYAIRNEFSGLYGTDFSANFADGWKWLAGSPLAVLLSWIVVTVGLAAVFTLGGRYASTGERGEE